MSEEKNESLHVWFEGGWQLHFFAHIPSAVVIEPSPGYRRFQVDDPRAGPYLTAVCRNPELTAQCQEYLGAPPWELMGAPLPAKSPLPGIAKSKWSNSRTEI